MTEQKIILVLVGPSGSGKTTIGKELSKRGIPKLVTSTTREPRAGEQHGVDYYFRTPEEMRAEPFVEQTTYNDQTYGLTVKEVEDALRRHPAVHVSLDQNGVEAMKRIFPQETKIVYFDVPEEKMKERMEKRGDSKEKVQERLAFGRSTGEYQAPEGTHLIVENNDLDHTIQKILDAFHLTAE